MRHRSVEGLHVVESGPERAPPVLFLHGWPQSAASFEGVMRALGDDMRALAIDLPGIGESVKPPPDARKVALAEIVHRTAAALGLSQLTLVGHDVGGMIAYAYLKTYPGTLARAAILDVVIPGVSPWAKVVANPQIWHFGFHAVPGLPEALVRGREAEYFAFFYDALSAKKSAIGPEARATYAEAYRRPEALTAGFEWYRAFSKDVKDNEATRAVAIDTPVLVVRGSEERGQLDEYVKGLREAGLTNVRGERIEGCGHFSPDEQPEALADLVRRFVGA